MNTTSRSIKSFCFVLIITVGFCLEIVSQTNSNSKIIDSQKTKETEKQQVANQVPSDCEYIRAVLDQAMEKSQNSKDSYLIIVFRLGEKEKSRKIIESRITGVDEFIKYRRAVKDYVLAEGSKVEGLGRAEVYVNGKLMDKLFFESNSPNLCEN